MSSGSGKKKVVAAAASPLSSVSITPNPVTSVPSTGGIKLLIDRSRIVNVLPPKTQSGVQRQSVPGVQNVSLIDSNADNLTNGSHAGSSTSVTTVPIRQKSIVKNLALPTITITHSTGTVDTGEMRVKVTGEDRNGQPLAAGGQLGPVKQSLLIRRPSTNRRVTVPTTPETDGINGQQAVVPSYTTVPLSDGNSLNRNTSANWQAKVISTAAVIPTSLPSASSTTIFVPVGHVHPSKTCNYRTGLTDVYSVPNMRYNSPSSQTSPDNIPTKKEHIDSVVTASGENTSPDFEGITTESLEDTDRSTGTDAASSSKVAGEEVISKPSREIKSLQLMQSRSKILTEFIADTSSKGKLRKRHSDGSADVESVNVDSSVAGTTTQLQSRKRLRRQSTIHSNAMDGKGLATDSSYRLDNIVVDSPVAKGRKGRSSAKLDCSLQKNTNEYSSNTKDDSTDFFTSLNLSYEQNNINEPSFPANPPKPGWDRFCWRCKKSDPDLGCCKCIRSYHSDCVRYSVDDPNWSCPECKTTQNVRADIESMSKCLGYVLDIITMHPEWNEMFNPIDKSIMPHYDKYITRHMDLFVLKKNLAQRAYKAPEEFLSDMSWIVHNMSIYPDKILLLKHARAMQKKSKHEIEEIEPCHECYIHANTQSEHWFKEPCSKPHLLVWAKLKGYPYWPGKLYMINNNNQAYVRFFATHDRSWLPVKDCFLYSQQDPNPSKNVKSKLTSSFANSVKDIEHHITRLREQFTIFNYGPFMELVDPLRHEEQQRTMLPGAYLKKVKVTIKRSEGEMVAVASSTNDEVQTLPKNKVRLELDKSATLVNKEPAKKGTPISPPRKRMTRRMSRILRDADEVSEQPLPRIECSQEVTNVPNVSLTPSEDKADKTIERNQSSDRTTDDKIEDSKSSDCNPKNLSLLLRRGSQSWETEPLSKRRKSTIDKTILLTAASKTNPPIAPTNVTETDKQIDITNMNKHDEEPTAEKPTSITSVKKSTMPEVNLTTTCAAKAKEPQKHTAELVAVTVPVEKPSPQKELVSAPVAAVVPAVVPASDPAEDRPSPPSATVTVNVTQDANASFDINQEVSVKEEIVTVPEVIAIAHDNNNCTLVAAREQTASVGSSESLLATRPVAMEISAVGKTEMTKGDTNSAPIPIVPSKQTARKSFPGGAGAKPVLPSGTLGNSKSALVSIPKELVAPSEELSMIPTADNQVDVCLGTVLNDQEDDVMIVEEAITSPIPCQEWTMNKNHQLPPPLAPKPPERHPPPSDSTIDLNNSMQIFDDSSNRVVDHIRMVMEDMLKEMSGKGSSLAELATLKLNLERQNELWRQEKQTMQQEFERKMADLRIAFGQEKDRSLKKQRLQLIGEKERAVHDAKMKQWCKKCYKEASYYCCWNTAYCSEKCQLIHWPEHQKTHSAPGINSILQPSFSTPTFTSSSQPDNNAAMRGRSALTMSGVSTFGSGDNSNVTKRSPANRFVPQYEIPPTSTPLPTPVHCMSSAITGFKTPAVQPVHGRDSIIIKMSQHSTQNGSNTTSTLNTVQQQLQMQKKNIARDKANLPNHQKAVSPNQVYVQKKASDIMPSPYQTSTTNAMKIPSSAYATATTTSDEVVGSSPVASSAWNNMAMLHPTANRQMHSGTTFSSSGGRAGTQKGQRHHLTITSIVQQAKPIQPSSTTYMRHQQ
ncbi:protein kinase C-binding protein 1 [Anopheles funestus]|uniref:protein kinase C-binding protein 1 n=1 Tax=Anopheles funestus TaxID=62324 RepID=UPI0020C5F72B|nr:protein kinase C-binding protein 1 [Anopheles funestus]XP_049286410.1 protein kinase C-binding protein 1 [Anopheles funestus]